MGEFVPTEAPLEGELAAQLTEGSRLGLWPSLAPEAQIPGFWNIRVCIPPPAEAFLKKSRTPQTRLSPGQLPFQGSQGLVRIRPGFLIPSVCTALIHRKRSPITFYGIAATGSYDHFDSLRDAPPLRRISEICS